MDDVMTKVTVNSWGLVVSLIQKGNSVLSAVSQTPITTLPCHGDS